MFLLLLQAGDIETNPGPENAYEVSIFHLNIRSIRNKLDFILDIFSEFNILCFSETHLDDNVPIEMLFLSILYSAPYRKDRINHGGVVLAYLNQAYFMREDHILRFFCLYGLKLRWKMSSF